MYATLPPNLNNNIVMEAIRYSCHVTGWANVILALAEGRMLSPVMSQLPNRRIKSLFCHSLHRFMAKQSMSLVFFRDHSRILMSMYSFTPSLHFTYIAGGGPRVVVSTAAFHARVRGSVPGPGGLKQTKNVWRTVSSQSSHHPQEVLLAQFSLYVHKGALKPDSFQFIHIHCNAINNASETS